MRLGKTRKRKISLEMVINARAEEREAWIITKSMSRACGDYGIGCGRLKNVTRVSNKMRKHGEEAESKNGGG